MSDFEVKSASEYYRDKAEQLEAENRALREGREKAEKVLEQVRYNLTKGRYSIALFEANDYFKEGKK